LVVAVVIEAVLVIISILIIIIIVVGLSKKYSGGVGVEGIGYDVRKILAPILQY
jgi:hypothetical protein